LYGRLYSGKIEQINKFLPEGLKIAQIKEISEKIPALTKSINTFDYQINLLGQKIDQASIDNLLTSRSLFVNRLTKGKERQIDIRPFVDDIQIKNGNLNIRTNIIEGRTVRIGELTGLLFGERAEELKYLPILRRNQLIRDNSLIHTPMDF